MKGLLIVVLIIVLHALCIASFPGSPLQLCFFFLHYVLQATLGCRAGNEAILVHVHVICMHGIICSRVCNKRVAEGKESEPGQRL